MTAKRTGAAVRIIKTLSEINFPNSRRAASRCRPHAAAETQKGRQRVADLRTLESWQRNIDQAPKGCGKDELSQLSLWDVLEKPELQTGLTLRPFLDFPHRQFRHRYA